MCSTDLQCARKKIASTGWAKKRDTSRTLHYIVREVSLFWPTRVELTLQCLLRNLKLRQRVADSP